ncbi:MAG: aminotransferase [Ahrensia sp.]|nr:aminotransferase [Ahrensia sp.]
MSLPSGHQQLLAEMGRQRGDALKTIARLRPQAGSHAALIADAGRLVLLGMGGSHWINRAAEPHYRACRIDATAHVLSEAMRAPLAGRSQLRIVTSQSGASGEIVRYLDEHPGLDRIIGMTLDPDSPLAKNSQALIGAGGVETAYAATRSLVVTLAMHAVLLEALGADIAGFEAALRAEDAVDTSAAEDLLAGCRNAVIVGRGPMQGVADAAALSFMELARIPVLGLEAGQFRHGPFEMVGRDSAVVFLRGTGPEGDNIDGIAGECVEAGLRPVIFDFSGEPDIDGCLTVRLPAREGLAAAASALMAVQQAIVSAASRMIEDVGVPLRSKKVTSGEAR